MSDAALAMQLMIKAHAGQVDLNGYPYLLHTLDVAERVGFPKLRGPVVQVAMLHDVLEDTEMTASQMVAAGIAPRVVQAISVLTRKKDENYEVYIKRVISSGDKLALQVKVADLNSNLSPDRGPCPGGLAKRYQKALKMIEGAA